MGCDDEIVQKNGWTPNVKIQGKIYHRISAFKPEQGQLPKFGQIYFYDQDEENAEQYRETEAQCKEKEAKRQEKELERKKKKGSR